MYKYYRNKIRERSLIIGGGAGKISITKAQKCRPPFKLAPKNFSPHKMTAQKIVTPPPFLDSFLPISHASNSDIISLIKYGYIVKNIPIHALNSISFEIFM